MLRRLSLLCSLTVFGAWPIDRQSGVAAVTSEAREAPAPAVPESEAAAALRRIGIAQRRVVSNVSIDTDANGRGEFGYLGELAGTAFLRIYDAAADAPGIGFDTLDPPLLPARFGQVVADGEGDGVVLLGGTVIKLSLADVPIAGKTPAVPEAPCGGGDAANLPDPRGGERTWCAYAWPLAAGTGARAVYFLNQEGVLLTSANADGRCLGTTAAPRFDAAFSNETGGDDLSAPLGITAEIKPFGFAANDGNVWVIAPGP